MVLYVCVAHLCCKCGLVCCSPESHAGKAKVKECYCVHVTEVNIGHKFAKKGKHGRRDDV